METIRPQKQLQEETLDSVDWLEFRQFAHNVLEDASYASGSRQLSVWRAVPDSVRSRKEVRKGSV